MPRPFFFQEGSAKNKVEIKINKVLVEIIENLSEVENFFDFIEKYTKNFYSYFYFYKLFIIKNPFNAIKIINIINSEKEPV